MVLVKALNDFGVGYDFLHDGCCWWWWWGSGCVDDDGCGCWRSRDGDDFLSFAFFVYDGFALVAGLLVGRNCVKSVVCSGYLMGENGN